MEERSAGDESEKEGAKSAEDDTGGGAGKIIAPETLRELCEEISFGKEMFEPGAEKVQDTNNELDNCGPG